MIIKTVQVKYRNQFLPMRRLWQLAIPILLFTGGACRELYNPEDIVSTERIPVIQGQIRENGEPVVSLTWALAYADNVAETISNARVTVSDDAGNSTELEETIAGTYTVAGESFAGVKGRTYTLRVELEDGKQYESNPVAILENTFSDSIYADPGTRDLITYGENNNPIIEQQEGLQIFADVYEETETPKYYRFEAKVTQEMSYTVDIGSLNSHTVFLWSSYMFGKSYAVGRSTGNGSQQVLVEQPLGFLRYYYDSNLETETSTAPYTDAWVIVFKVYSVTADAYHYYHSIANQLVSNNQMFAPDPSQVNSNIRCTTDQTQKVIGIFEASSCKTIYKAFSWIDQDRHRSKPLDYFPPDIAGGTQERFAPNFWIFF